MKYVTVIIVVILLFTEAVMPFSGNASIGNFFRRAGQEIGEFVTRKGGKEALEEGSKVGVEKIGQFFARYGAHGRQAFNLVGDDAIRFASRYGQEGVEMIAAHSISEACFLVRHADDAVSIWRIFGRQGTELMVLHPGIAKTLLDTCGSRGLVLAKKLSQQNLVRLTYFSKKITRENLDTIITWSLAKGDEVMAFLWRHKVKIIAGATVHSLLKKYEKGFTATTLGADGKPLMEYKTHSFIQHWINILTSHTIGAYPWLLPVLGGGLFLYIFVTCKKFFFGMGKLFMSVGKVMGKYISSVGLFFSVRKNNLKKI